MILMRNRSASQPLRTAGRSRRRWLNWLLPAPTFALTIVLIVVPLFMMLWVSLHPIDRASFSFENYRQLFDGPLYATVFLRTAWSAALAAVVTVALALPAAWALSRMQSRWRTFVLSLVVVPYLTSYLLLIYSMFVILGPDGPVAEVLHALRLVGAQDSVLYTPWATVIIFAYESLAVAIFVIYAVSERVTRGHLEAAASLGASAWYRFKHVIAPLLSPGILGAFLIIIVPMGGAFAESDILGGPNGQLAGNVINYQMNTAGDESMAATLSIALLIVLGLAVGLIYWAFRGIRRVRRGYAHQ